MAGEPPSFFFCARSARIERIVSSLCLFFSILAASSSQAAFIAASSGLGTLFFEEGAAGAPSPEGDDDFFLFSMGAATEPFVSAAAFATSLTASVVMLSRVVCVAAWAVLRFPGEGRAGRWAEEEEEEGKKVEEEEEGSERKMCESKTLLCSLSLLASLSLSLSSSFSPFCIFGSHGLFCSLRINLMIKPKMDFLFLRLLFRSDSVDGKRLWVGITFYLRLSFFSFFLWFPSRVAAAKSNEKKNEIERENQPC